jgi:hypothetical protein
VVSIREHVLNLPPDKLMFYNSSNKEIITKIEQNRKGNEFKESEVEFNKLFFNNKGFNSDKDTVDVVGRNPIDLYGSRCPQVAKDQPRIVVKSKKRADVTESTIFKS